MTVDLDRRGFLKFAGSAGIAFSLPSFLPGAGMSFAQLSDLPAPAYRSWLDVYRRQWTWDRVVRSTHFLNCWYQAACAWDVYVKDGVVLREEQAGEYPQIHPDVPDFNPRGCQKGACYSHRMYDPTRLKHPLKRVGPRGGGKWQRVSWDEALDAIADSYLDVVLEEGTDRVVIDEGTNISFGVINAGIGRFSLLTQSVILEPNSEIGDQHRGAFETFGKMLSERSADDFFRSDLVLVWGCNPIYTQIPNAHFYTEARYNGTRFIAISPDHNASATKADLWVPINPGTDAALALSICHVLIEEGLVAHDFVVEQTDLPLLVRTDTSMFLTPGDLGAATPSAAARHCVLDGASGAPRPVPADSLALGELRPVLDAHTSVRLADGSEVEVRSVYSLLVARLRDYAPEQASAHCGVSPALIRRLAREIAAAKAVSNITSSNLSKYYHGNLSERGIILIFCLTGNMGRQGAGYSAFPGLTTDGVEKFASVHRLEALPQFFEKIKPLVDGWRAAGATDEMIAYEMARMPYQAGTGLPIFTSAALFWAVHGGVMDLARQSWDPFLKRPIGEHVAHSVDQGWQPLEPRPGRTPRIIMTVAGNTLRRVRGSKRLLEKLWPELRLHVVFDLRISSTARFADYVLPVASYYERTDHRYATPLMPFLHVGEAATPPYGESKSDWAIFTLLAKHIQARARARGIAAVKTAHGLEIHLDRLYDDFTMDGQFREDDEDKVAKTLLDLSTNLGAVDWEELKKKGFVRFAGVGTSATSVGNMCEIPAADTMAPHTWHVRDKVPWPTATKRIQFYLDHPLYIEHDEELPRYKAPPAIGGAYPLMLTGGHTRWSIHSTWRDSAMMLRLHRPEPYVLMNEQDAAARGIAEGDLIRIRNDTGKFVARAKVAPAIRPGQTIIYHAWENYQFREGSARDTTPSPLNPVETAGGHAHLRYNALTGQCGNFDRDTRVEIEKVEGARQAV